MSTKLSWQFAGCISATPIQFLFLLTSVARIPAKCHHAAPATGSTHEALGWWPAAAADLKRRGLLWDKRARLHTTLLPFFKSISHGACSLVEKRRTTPLSNSETFIHHSVPRSSSANFSEKSSDTLQLKGFAVCCRAALLDETTSRVPPAPCL